MARRCAGCCAGWAPIRRLADDVAQDAFLAAFERIAEFRGDGTFAAWVKRIAARLYLKRWRGAARDRAFALASRG